MKKMKHNIHIVAALLMAGAALAACSSDSETIGAAPEAAAKETPVYTLTVDALKGDDTAARDTRALADGGSTLTATWASTDKIYVKNGSTWATGHLTPQGEGATAQLRGDLSGVTFSVGDELTLQFPNSTPADYTSGQDGTLEKIATAYDYAVATGVKVTAVNGNDIATESATFQSQQAVVKFTLKKKGDGSNLNATALTVKAGTTTYSITPASATNVLYVALPGFSGETITLTATGEDAKTYTYEKSGVSFTNGLYYTIAVKMTESSSAPAGVQAVDLGLSVKWANMNVGAESVTDYGKYYAWGATTDNLSEDKTYEWENTPYRSGDSWTKYTGSDGKTVLESGDDAAAANWGGSWRMPTEAEIQELIDNTTRTWQTNYQGVSGCNGYLFTSTKSGYTDKSIFLPAAGFRNGSSLNAADSYGRYWSSTLNTRSVGSGYNLFFYSGGAPMSNSYRFSGYSVRAVQ